MIKRFNTIGIFLVFSFALLLVFATLQPAMAQPGGGTNPCPGGEPCDPDIPISGIEWLLVAGGLYGARMVKRKLKD
jgi:hypothetical protein